MPRPWRLSAAEAAANLAARQDEHAHAQPTDPPTVEVGMHLEINTLIEVENEIVETIHYKQ